METQTVEYKRQWKDEYLHYVSAFANAQGGVLATIQREKFVAMQKDGGVSSGVNGGVYNGVNELTERQQVIVKLILSNPFISAKNMAQVAHIAYRTIQRELSSMQKQNIIHREGPKNGGRWVVVE